MGIKFQCHHCGHPLHVKDFQAGKKGRCPACKGQFRIPQSDAQLSLDPQEEASSVGNAVATTQQASPAGTTRQGNSLAVTASKAISNRPTLETAKSTDSISVSEISRPQVEEHPELPGTSGIDQIQTQPREIAEAPNATWYVRPASGGQFGPAPTAVVWQWLIEDRIGHDSLVWREDWPEWLSAHQAFNEYFSTDQVEAAARTAIDPSAHQLNLDIANSATLPVVPKAASSITGAGGSREMRKRNRRLKYSVAIAILIVILLSLAIGLVVVLYQQGILGSE